MKDYDGTERTIDIAACFLTTCVWVDLPLRLRLTGNAASRYASMDALD